MNLIRDIEIKFEHAVFYGHKITQRTEMFIGKMYSEFRNHCIRKNLNRHQCEQFLEEVKSVLFPFDVITQQNYINTFNSTQAYEEEKYILKLKNIVTPLTQYDRFRKDLLKSGKLLP